MINSLEELKARIAKINEFIDKVEDPENKQKEINEVLLELENYSQNIRKLFDERLMRLRPKAINSEIDKIRKEIRKVLEYERLVFINEDYYRGLKFNYLFGLLEHPLDLTAWVGTLNQIHEELKKVSLKLSINDYDFSADVKNLMNIYFENEDADNETQIAKLKVAFDEIYWKNNEILFEVTIAVRELITKYEKEIKTYYAKAKIEYERQNADLVKDHLTYKRELISKLHELKNKDAYLIYTTFKDKELELKDFIMTPDKTFAAYFNFITPQKYGTLSEESKKIYYANILELWNNINEYEKFEFYRFLVDKIKEVVGKKAEHEGKLKIKESEINKLAKIRSKVNIKLNKLVSKKEQKKTDRYDKKISKLTTELRTSINGLIEQYKDYNEVGFYNRVLNTIKEDSLLSEVFVLYQKNTEELSQELKEHLPEAGITEIKELLKNYSKFVNNINNRLLLNINYNDIDKIKNLIEDKYRLLDIDLTIPDTKEPLFQELKTNIKKIIFYENMKTLSITPEDIKILLEFDK